MRWPFGPPHSQKKTEKQTNQQKKTETETTTSNHKTKQSKQTKTKPTPKRKAKTRNTKTPKPSKPNKQEEATPQSPKIWGKNKLFLHSCHFTRQKNTMTLKPAKRNKQKTPFYHVQKQPTIFHTFSVFCLHAVFVLQLLCFSENTIKRVRSDKKKKKKKTKKQLFKNTVSKTHFFTHAKKHLFPTKRCHFWFWAISAETTIFIVLPGLHCFGPKQILAKTDSVHENARFSPFLTQIVSGNFCKKIHFFDFSRFWMTTFKKHYFYRVFWPFPFYFSRFYFSNLKKEKAKNAIFFSNTSVLTSPKICKTTILAQCDTICVFKNTPKTL